MRIGLNELLHLLGASVGKLAVQCRQTLQILGPLGLVDALEGGDRLPQLADAVLLPARDRLQLALGGKERRVQRSLELVKLADAGAVLPAGGRGRSHCSCGRLSPQSKLVLGLVECFAVLFQTAEPLIELVPIKTELRHAYHPSRQTNVVYRRTRRPPPMRTTPTARKPRPSGQHDRACTPVRRRRQDLQHR